MPGKWCAILLVVFVTVTPVAADPNPQLVSSVENRLKHYGLSADVKQFATSTVAALHLTLSSPEGYLKTRRQLQAILRNARYK